MSLTPGVRLAGYEVQALLGAGGMGEVYKASDTRLGRTVAIKVLPAHAADDPTFRQRFEREAQTLASLSDPHICSVFDVGRQDGIDFVVMEFLEGETLAERLSQKGRLPAAQAIAYAVQIADGLATAHRAGIVHRDLKPANIMLTKGGAKLLDFGLAKWTAIAMTGATSMQTANAPLTGTGSIVGTFQYMSPEQVEGREADSRSDIFAFGATLYEMLTGQRAFEGKSQASVIAAILERQPPPASSVQPAIPRALDRVLAGCMAKDPDERWQSARDVARQLRAIAEEATSGVAETVALPRRQFPRMAAFAVAVGLAGLLIGAAATLALLPQPSAAPVVTERLSIVPTADDPLIFTGGVPQSSLAISPDGRRIAYRGPRGWVVRALDAMTVTPVGGGNSVSAFFSPDGEWIAFASGSRLQKVAVGGGPPVTIGDQLSDAGFGDWIDPATIVLASGAVLNRVRADGGGSEPLTTRDAAAGEVHDMPSVVAGANAIIFTVFPSGPSGSLGVARVEALRLDTRQRHVVLENARGARHLASGHVLFQRDDAVLVAPFEARTLTVSGPAVPLSEDVRREGQFSGGDRPQLAMSSNGSLVYVSGQNATNQLGWVDAAGAFTPLALAPGRFDVPRLSPDKTQIAFEVYVGGGGGFGAANTVGVFNIPRAASSTLSNARPLRWPIWHPDGGLTVFSGRPDAPGIYLIRPDGSEQLITAEPRGADLRPGAWSPDGRTLAYTAQGDLQEGEHIWTITSGEAGSARRMLPTHPHEHSPAFSPDGRWLAFVSYLSGVSEVYVKPFPEGTQTQVTFKVGTAPVWHPTANRLFVQTEGAIQEVLLTFRDRSVQVGAPRRLLPFPVVSPSGQLESYRTSNNYGPRFQVGSDGRLLVARGADPRNIREIVLVRNWFEELKRIAPAGSP